MNPSTLFKFVVSRIFQKLPGGLCTAAMRRLPFHVFSRFLRGTAWW